MVDKLLLENFKSCYFVKIFEKDPITMEANGSIGKGAFNTAQGYLPPGYKCMSLS